MSSSFELLRVVRLQSVCRQPEVLDAYPARSNVK